MSFDVTQLHESEQPLRHPALGGLSPFANFQILLGIEPSFHTKTILAVVSNDINLKHTQADQRLVIRVRGVQIFKPNLHRRVFLDEKHCLYIFTILCCVVTGVEVDYKNKPYSYQ
jgi:hypothetical protein